MADISEDFLAILKQCPICRVAGRDCSDRDRRLVIGSIFTGAAFALGSSLGEQVITDGAASMAHALDAPLQVLGVVVSMTCNDCQPVAQERLESLCAASNRCADDYLRLDIQRSMEKDGTLNVSVAPADAKKKPHR